jgi:hypothetical protein
LRCFELDLGLRLALCYSLSLSLSLSLSIAGTRQTTRMCQTVGHAEPASPPARHRQESVIRPWTDTTATLRCASLAVASSPLPFQKHLRLVVRRSLKPIFKARVLFLFCSCFLVLIRGVKPSHGVFGPCALALCSAHGCTDRTTPLPGLAHSLVHYSSA